MVECERSGGADGLRHQARSLRGARPSNSRWSGLRDPTPDVAHIETAKQSRVRLAEDQVGIALVIAQLALVLAQTPSKV